MIAPPAFTVMVGSPLMPISSDNKLPVPGLRIQLWVNPALPKIMPPIDRGPSSVTVASVAGVTVPKLAMPSAPLASVPLSQFVVAGHEPPPAVVQVPLAPDVVKARSVP
jgi:hypothetical protein